MSKEYQDVMDFIKEVRGVTLPTEFNKLHYKTRDDRMLYMYEELTEFVDAANKYQELDAMIDLVYFAFGTMAEMGVNAKQFSEAWSRVHNANMAKKAGKKEGRSTNGIDAAKPDDWKEPTFEDIFNE